jgi:hypothetical protein
MTQPVETVKKFIRPLVDKAYKRQSMRPAANAIKPRGSLLDHLINSLDSQYRDPHADTAFSDILTNSHLGQVEKRSRTN